MEKHLLTFVNSSDYGRLKSGDHFLIIKNRSGEDIKLPVLILPEGSQLHRYDKEKKGLPSTEIPLFLGDEATYRIYAGKGKTAEEIDKSKTSFVVKKDKEIKLLELNINSLESLKKFFEGDDYKFLSEYFIMLDGHLGIFPSIPYGKIGEIAEGDITEYSYTFNRRFAEIICKLGFDGWVIKPYNEEKGEGINQFINKGELDTIIKNIVSDPGRELGEEYIKKIEETEKAKRIKESRSSKEYATYVIDKVMEKWREEVKKYTIMELIKNQNKIILKRKEMPVFSEQVGPKMEAIIKKKFPNSKSLTNEQKIKKLELLDIDRLLNRLFEVKPHPAEIMICKWNEHLDYIDEMKGGKRTKRKTRNHKHKTTTRRR